MVTLGFIPVLLLSTLGGLAGFGLPRPVRTII